MYVFLIRVHLECILAFGYFVTAPCNKYFPRCLVSLCIIKIMIDIDGKSEAGGGGGGG